VYLITKEHNKKKKNLS